MSATTHTLLLWGFGWYVPLLGAAALATSCQMLRAFLRARRLDLRMAENQVRLSHKRPQVGRKPTVKMPTNGQTPQVPAWLEKAVEER